MIPFFDGVKARIVRALTRAQAPLKEALERSMLLNAKVIENSNLSKPTLSSLHDAEFRVFSQWGEDGIIAWLIGHLSGVPQTFVEFGGENYQESNTRHLLQSKNWRGLVIDGSQDNIADIRRQELYWRHELSAACAFIDRDNINTLIDGHGFKGEIGLLSVDIDGNDYWVWQAIDAVNPAIVVCEYNAVLGDRFALTVPYQADFQRSIAHYSCLYFGASIKALILLAKKKGYRFIGTTSTGCNAFFVRNDFATDILARLEQVSMFPSRVREARDETGTLNYSNGVERMRAIAELTFLDIEKGTTAPLGSYGDLYSPEWSAGTQRFLLKNASGPQV